jgi:hypothetical protein
MTYMLEGDSVLRPPSIAFDGSWRNPMSAPFTVFVCSTFDDLEQEREAVLDAIRRVQSRRNAMEFFGARPGRPIDVCLDEVRNSDLLSGSESLTGSRRRSTCYHNSARPLRPTAAELLNSF